MPDKEDKTQPEVQNAILVAGQLIGMSLKLDADTLEKWLNTKPKGFNYKKHCQAAIAFKRALDIQS